MAMQHLKDELNNFGELATKQATELSVNFSKLIHSEKVTSVLDKLQPRKWGTSTDAALAPMKTPATAVAEHTETFTVAVPVETDTTNEADQKKKVLNRTSTMVASPDQALEALMEGHDRFLAGTCLHPHQSIQHLKRLSDSQRPFAAVLGCADSRVPPEILFDQGFGDLFVCRVAGNLASPEQVASLEYAVAHLKIKLIMILGHAKCGACSAALADILQSDGDSSHELEGHLDVLVDHLAVAVERGRHHDHIHTENLLDDIVKENVIYQVERLRKAPMIKRALAAGQIKIVGGYYDIDNFRVSIVAECDKH